MILFFAISFLNGFLPCGLVYMAIFGALATSNAFKGSLYLFLFGLGTISLMTTVVYLGHFTKDNFRRNIQKAIPVFVVFIGTLFILRDLRIGIAFISPLEPVLSYSASSASVCH